MAPMPCATLRRVCSLLVFASLALTATGRADDLTGLSHDDPKDLLPTPPQSAPCPNSGDIAFVPLPTWARSAVMPPLPPFLRPDGKVAVLTTPPAPAPLAPPPSKEEIAPTVVISKPIPAAAAAAAGPPQPTALVAVSPFLDWIKSNPREAAQQARQEAGAYGPGPDAGASRAPGSPGVGSSTPGTVVTPASSGAQSATPYWMPPLIDTAPFGATSGGSSAAIYTTPQR